MEQEQWKPIQEFNGEYEVSNLGRVRSMKRYDGQVGRIMPQTKQHHGYHAVMFWMDNKAHCRKVHRLVAQYFLPNPDNLKEVNHIDGNHDNNQVSNLEWITHQANVQHSFDAGIKQPHRLTDEERQHLSDINKGKTLTSEHRAKISAALKGRKRST